MRLYKLTWLCLLLFAMACSNKQTKTQTVQPDTVSKKTAAVKYTCTMHPDVITNKPGTCPKCGMDLVEKDDSK